MLINSWSDYSSYFSDKSIIAGFTNQYHSFSPVNDRIEFAKILKLDYSNIVMPKQIHSNNISICTKAGNIIDTDGIITNNKDLILSIQVADCIPIYLYHRQNNIIGLVHAGWRGVNSGLIEKSITKMMELDSESINIKVLLGPSIRQCCFEIGREVGILFDNKLQKTIEGDKTQLDLQGVVIDRLINMDIQNKNIIDINECTCCSDKYHSYRRDGDKAGRMIAMIGWRTD
ncbi:MAG: peptidoglycan editing factor PgeF [Planctomycetia bacterium]|nr:peptidoglycan editing factor PgeF [Planctomycetia bacterium]